MGNKQRSVRLPEEMWRWLDQLPDRYGTVRTPMSDSSSCK